MPVGPEFRDPDKVANLPPYFAGDSTPYFQREVPAPQTFEVTVKDPNPNDRLYVRWVSNYPPYEEAYSKLLLDAPAKEGGITPDSKSKFGTVPADCSIFTTGSPNPHTLVVIVADRPFKEPDAPDDPFRYNKVDAGGAWAMQGWTVRCQ